MLRAIDLNTRHVIMGRKTITGGAMSAGSDRIQFDLSINGRRLRPTFHWVPTKENLPRALAQDTQAPATALPQAVTPRGTRP
jgi:hypothetical protein